MGPKKNKKEKMREIRRQGDPNFPVPASTSNSSSSQNASRIPRPSILLSGRQNAPQQESLAVKPAAISKEPKEPTAASKSTSSKGLRVTFDLTENHKDDDPEVGSEEVAECWEDLSDDFGHKGGDSEYEINDEDVIDCEREFGDLGDEFLDFDHGTSTFGVSGRGPVGQGSSKVNFFVGPRHIPGLNDIEDFNAIGDDDYGSDYDNVETSRNYMNNGEQSVRYFTEDTVEIPVVHDDANVANIITVNDILKNVEVPKVTEIVMPVAVDHNSSVAIEKDKSENGARIESKQIKRNASNGLPFIDGAEEVAKAPGAVYDDDDDDDDWETEQSGGSDESGKIYKIENNYAPKASDSSGQQNDRERDAILHLSSSYDDGTIADQPSLGEEDDSDIITNEDMDAAFHSVMKEDDEAVPEGFLSEKKETATIVEGNPVPFKSGIPVPIKNSIPSGTEQKLELNTGLSEKKPDWIEPTIPKEGHEELAQDTAGIQVALSDAKPEEPTYGKLAEDDKLKIKPSFGSQKVEHEEVKESLHKSPVICDEVVSTQVPEVELESLGESKESEEMKPPEESYVQFIGPLEKLDEPKESQLEIEPVSCEDSVDWPKVSIGFECREGKPKAIYGSETESEGELVIGEDKCVGTADDYTVSDDEPVDLSVSERTSSKGENDMSASRDSLTFRSEDESQSERGNLAPDPDKHEVSANSGTSHLDVPTGKRLEASPSPEIPTDAPIGNSESGKEKEKVAEKKNTKKKGKKNKRDGKLDQSKAEMHPDRPRLVRGRTWKEKREKFKTDHGDDALPLSFGDELCESEIVEGTSNLLTETYTEASLLTASRCSTETTIVTETPCTACSSRTGEFSESDSLCKGCLRGDKKRPADAIAQVTEMKACDENLCHTPTVTQMSNAKAGHLFEIEKDLSGRQTFPLPNAEKDDFYVVKACEVAVPLEVLTEYVADSESSEEINRLHVSGKNNKRHIVGGDNIESRTISGNGIDEGEPELFVDSSNSNSSDDQNPAYFDAKDSSCADKLAGSYDYVESFPGVIGTQNISYVYSYDGHAEYERQTGRPKLTVKPLKSSQESSGVTVVSLGEDSNSDDSDTPLTLGEIVYEGPCMCGPGERAEHPNNVTSNEGFSSEEDVLCVPPLFGDNYEDHLVDNGKTMGVETHEVETNENMGSNPEDLLLGNSEGDSKDIRSRIKEIVGPRLHHKRGRHTVRRRGGGTGGGTATAGDQEHLNLDPEAGGGRDESPMPGSSPASSSGIQGSDEMSPSRSCSRSPSRGESVSPPSTMDNVSDLAYEVVYQVPEISPTKGTDDLTKNVGELSLEGNLESSPEKGGTQVDYSFQTFRDMYQINPVYTTDSDDHDDLNESDTVVQGSSGLSYDPDRSITVSSWGSTSEESPAPLDPSTSPPLPPGGRGTKKVPKVTKQLRETQGIVQRWEVLQAQAVERQRLSNQVRELQRQVKNLRLTLENLAERANETPQIESLGNHQQLDHKLQEARALVEEVRSRKADVSSLNLTVHRFFTDGAYSLAQMKDEVNDLYVLYDEAHRRATAEVSRLEGLEATWKLWEAEVEELNRALRQDGDTLKVLDAAIQTGSLTDSVTASMQDVARLLNDRRKSQQPGKKLMLQHTRTQGVDIQGSTLSLGTSGDDCLSDSGTSGYESCSSEELSERERRLAHLRRLARDLEASLSPDSQAWLAITKTLSSAELELKGLQKHCRDLVVRSTETLEQTKASPQLRRRSWAKDSKVGRLSRSDRRISSRDSNRGNGRRGWMWRVVRAALPFQAALLLLFCVACLLEPNCCDTHNSLTMTLTPQLRYVHGPPPV